VRATLGDRDRLTSPKLAAMMLTAIRLGGMERLFADPPRPTRREMDVAAFAAQGHANKTIAAILGIETAGKDHVHP